MVGFKGPYTFLLLTVYNTEDKYACGSLNAYRIIPI